MRGRSRPRTVSTKLLRIAELAREDPKRVLTTLAHHIDIEFLQEAFRRTRKDGAVGVDGKTAKQYERDLKRNLQLLLDRFKSGTYKAPPVRRVHIPKGDGSKTRPIGIPTFEDKILQRAVSMILEAVYEQEFLPCSFGFRPGRSAHQALDHLWQELMDMRGGWVIEVDIKSYFDAISHQHLRTFLDQRVRDGVIRRAIDKWLKAGVMEDGQLHRPDAGSPQGGVVSPILSNVFLHEVLDQWFETVVKVRLEARAVLVRYADDALMVFASERDARRVFEVLPKRFAKYGLTLHPEKTRLVRFYQPRAKSPGKGRDAGGGTPGSFDLLGFRHFWGRARKGNWVVKRRTAPSRFSRAISRITEWCRQNRHRRVAEQHADLSRKLTGHYAYYGITGNSSTLARFRYEVQRIWRRWLDRRSERGTMRWKKFNFLLRRYPLPPARCVHSIYVT